MTKDTELADAIQNGDAVEVERLLAERPVSVNSPEWTPPPLHCAVLWNQPQIAEVLLEHGADIEIRDPDRQTTPLRYAIVYCKTELISLLLSRGACAGVIKEGGTTAMELAIQGANGGFEEYDDTPSQAEYSKIVDLLRELGAE